MRSLVISVFLCACESWNVTAELEKMTLDFEMNCLLQKVSEHLIHGPCHQAAIGKYDELLSNLVQETETKVIWECLNVFRLSKDNSAGHSARKKAEKVDRRNRQR